MGRIDMTAQSSSSNLHKANMLINNSYLTKNMFRKELEKTAAHKPEQYQNVR